MLQLSESFSEHFYWKRGQKHAEKSVQKANHYTQKTGQCCRGYTV